MGATKRLHSTIYVAKQRVQLFQGCGRPEPGFVTFDKDQGEPSIDKLICKDLSCFIAGLALPGLKIRPQITEGGGDVCYLSVPKNFSE